MSPPKFSNRRYWLAVWSWEKEERIPRGEIYSDLLNPNVETAIVRWFPFLNSQYFLLSCWYCGTGLNWNPHLKWRKRWRTECSQLHAVSGRVWPWKHFLLPWQFLCLCDYGNNDFGSTVILPVLCCSLSPCPCFFSLIRMICHFPLRQVL